MYRAIHKYLQITTYTDYKNLLDAYKSCIMRDNDDSCRLLFNGLKERIENGETLIRIYCNKSESYWIQCITESNEVIDSFYSPCHTHQT